MKESRSEKSKREFYELAEENGCVVLGEYVKSNINVLVKCPVGHEWSIRPANLKSGHGCPKCAGQCSEQAKEDFYKDADTRGYTILGEYIDAAAKVLMRCPVGHEWSVSPSSFKSGCGCLKCSGKCPEQSKEEFYKGATDRNHVVLGEYTGARAKVLMKCPEDHEFLITPSKFKYGRGCPKCSGRCSEQANERFLKLVSARGYTAIGEYVRANKKVLMKCPDGHEWHITPGNFKTGYGCPKCSCTCPEQAKEEFYKAADIRGYKVIGEYVGSDKKVLMKCPVGHEWSPTPIGFKKGSGCLKCSGHCPEQSKEVLYSEATARGYTVLGEYVSNSTKILMKCSEGHEFLITPNHFKTGNGCSSCAEHGFKSNKSAYFYLTTWTLEGYDVLKFGITNNEPATRFYRQSRLSEYNVKSHVHLKFASGLHAIWLEKIVKRYQKEYGSALSKEEFPDGYTETIDYSHYANMMDIINDYVGGLVEHGIEVEWG